MVARHTSRTSSLVLGDVLFAQQKIIDGDDGPQEFGPGDDVYIVDDPGDIVGENPNEGTDTVLASISYGLTDNVENLTLTGGDTINGSGNSLNNTIIGNGADNTINGAGGNDFLDGAGGNDSLSGSTGVDTFYGGDGNDIMGGGTGVDTVDGGNGADTIAGGAGLDTLIGGAGADGFLFADAPGVSTIDTIVDFNIADDTIFLVDALFTALGATVDAGEFVIGTSALDANDFIIYDPATGALYYDADGSGAGAPAVQFATLGTGLALTAGDFGIWP